MSIKLNLPFMLVSYNTSCWNGAKLDRQTSEDVDQTKDTKTRVAKVTKNLMAGVESLDAIRSLINNTRLDFYRRTLPWDDDGKRVLNAATFMEFNQWAKDRERSFDQLVDAFVSDYSNIITTQAFKLGKWFNRADYPDPAEIRTRFALKFNYTPMPQAGDFRLDAFNEVQAEAAQQFEQRAAEQVERAMQDAWDRMHKLISRIIEQMEPREDGKRRRIHDSMMESAYDMCHMLTSFNMTGDPKLEQARRELEAALSGTSTHVLRASDNAREALRDKMREIQSKFSI